MSSILTFHTKLSKATLGMLNNLYNVYKKQPGSSKVERATYNRLMVNNWVQLPLRLNSNKGVSSSGLRPGPLRLISSVRIGVRPLIIVYYTLDYEIPYGNYYIVIYIYLLL